MSVSWTGARAGEVILAPGNEGNEDISTIPERRLSFLITPVSTRAHEPDHHLRQHQVTEGGEALQMGQVHV